jgi:hypothetical protein
MAEEVQLATTAAGPQFNVRLFRESDLPEVTRIFREGMKGIDPENKCVFFLSVSFFFFFLLLFLNF